MRFFTSLDDALFDRLFQPLTALLSARLGLARRGVTNFCLDGACITWILARANGLSDAVSAWNPPDALLKLLLLMLGLVALISLRVLFRRIQDRRANPLRAVMLPHRAVILLLLMARLLQPADGAMQEAAEAAMLLLTWAALYFGACSEPPPVRHARSRLAGAEA